MHPRPILVESQEDTAACLRAAAELGCRAVMVTPFSGASLHGPRFWAAIEQHCRRNFPDTDFLLIVDCGDEGGVALQALALGLKQLIFAPNHPSRARLRTIADAQDATLHEPPATCLRLPLDARPRDKLALCREWLAPAVQPDSSKHALTEVTHAD